MRIDSPQHSRQPSLNCHWASRAIQTVMSSLSMVAIAAIIGACGLGSIVVDALAQTEVGREWFAGLGAALTAMTADRLVQIANQANMP